MQALSIQKTFSLSFLSKQTVENSQRCSYEQLCVRQVAVRLFTDNGAVICEKKNNIFLTAREHENDLTTHTENVAIR